MQTDDDEFPGREPTWLDLALSRAALDVLYERHRQYAVLGWTHRHDDEEHGPEQLAVAAACYLLHADTYPYHGKPPPAWPWDAGSWKPKGQRDDFKRAGALLLAAMECLDRRTDERNRECSQAS